MRLLVASAVNQIGFFALPEALARGHEVFATRRSRRFAQDPASVTWVDSPVDHAPEGLIFCGPLSLAAPLVEQLAPHGLKAVVAFGSASIHFKQRSTDPDDRVLVARLREGEAALRAICMAHGVSGTILRPTLIYGCGLDENVTMLAGLIRRLPVLPVPVGAHGLRQPVHARDLAILALKAVEAARPGFEAYDAPGGEALPYSAMLRRVARLLGLWRPVIAVPGLIHAYILARRLGFLTRGPSPVQLERMCKPLAVDGAAAFAAFDWRPQGFLAGGLTDLDNPAARVVRDAVP